MVIYHSAQTSFRLCSDEAFLPHRSVSLASSECFRTEWQRICPPPRDAQTSFRDVFGTPRGMHKQKLEQETHVNIRKQEVILEDDLAYHQ